MIEHAILVADLSGVIQIWNHGAEKLFGYTAAEAVGQTLDLIVPESARDAHWKGFRASISSGVGRIEGQSADIPVRCRDGQVLAFPARFMLLRDARDEVVGALAIYRPRDA